MNILKPLPLLFLALLILWLIDHYILATREPVRCDGGEPEKYDVWMWIDKERITK